MSPDTQAPFNIEDLAGPEKKAPEPPKLSEKQYRDLRRQFMTVRLAEVTACGHKFDSRRVPSNNCPDCWYAFFKTAVDLAKLHDELKEIGTAGLVSKYGKKYVKWFQRFLSIELAVVEGADPVETFEQATEKMKIENGIIPPVEKGPIGIPEETTAGAA